MKSGPADLDFSIILSMLPDIVVGNKQFHYIMVDFYIKYLTISIQDKTDIMTPIFYPYQRIVYPRDLQYLFGFNYLTTNLIN